MMEGMVGAVLWVMAGYLGVGTVFAVFFVFRGVGRIDANAQGAGPGFRLLILPGAAALWPVLMVRWMRAQHAVIQEGTNA